MSSTRRSTVSLYLGVMLNSSFISNTQWFQEEKKLVERRVWSYGYLPVTGTGTSTRAKETRASLAAIIASATSFIIAETLSGDRNCESTFRPPVLQKSEEPLWPFLLWIELGVFLRDCTLRARFTTRRATLQKDLPVEYVATGHAIVNFDVKPFSHSDTVVPLSYFVLKTWSGEETHWRPITALLFFLWH